MNGQGLAPAFGVGLPENRLRIDPPGASSNNFRHTGT